MRPALPSPQLGRLSLVLLLTASSLLLGCQVQPPVSVSARESLMGQGQVIRVTNVSDGVLTEVRVRITAPEGGESREHFEASLDPGEDLEVGWLKLEGWPVPEGAKVEVTAKGFLTAKRFE